MGHVNMLKASAPEDTGQLCFPCAGDGCFLSMHRELAKQGSELLDTWSGINNKVGHFSCLHCCKCDCHFEFDFLASLCSWRHGLFPLLSKNSGCEGSTIKMGAAWENYSPRQSNAHDFFFFTFSLLKKQVFGSVSLCLNSVLRDQPKKAWIN